MWWILGAGAIATAWIAYDPARGSYCSACVKPFGVFSVDGTLGHKRVCRACLRQRRALQRSHAR